MGERYVKFIGGKVDGQRMFVPYDEESEQFINEYRVPVYPENNCLKSSIDIQIYLPRRLVRKDGTSMIVFVLNGNEDLIDLYIKRLNSDRKMI